MIPHTFMHLICMLQINKLKGMTDTAGEKKWTIQAPMQAQHH